MDIGLDWRAIKLFLAGWGVSAFFWIPLTILAMRVMAQMGVAQMEHRMQLGPGAPTVPAPLWAHRISTWLREVIYRGK